jgi:hypothetical protein
MDFKARGLRRSPLKARRRLPDCPALTINIYASPGFIVGFFVYTNEGPFTLKLSAYNRTAMFPLLGANPDSIFTFGSLEEALIEGPLTALGVKDPTVAIYENLHTSALSPLLG